MGFELYGKLGLLSYVINKVKKDHSCIIVVSEGAGICFFNYHDKNLYKI